MPSTATDRLNGLSTSQAVKTPCKAVSTVALTLYGAQTVGGRPCVAGDRVLYTPAGGSSATGIYIVQNTAWTRAPDWDGALDVVSGTMVLVGPGTSSHLWRVTTTGSIVIGTTAVELSELDVSGINFGWASIVSDYGATGDGVTDDEDAVLAAEAGDHDYISLDGRAVYASVDIDLITKNYFNGELFVLNNNGNRTQVRPLSPFKDIEINRGRSTKSPVTEWRGKLVLWTGTSIPRYDDGPDTSYPERFGLDTGAVVTNSAHPGSHAHWTQDVDAYGGDPMVIGTVAALSMLEADRLAMIATLGTGTAYSDGFHPVTQASQMTLDYKIATPLQTIAYDVMWLDHGRNDTEGIPGTLDPTPLTINSIGAFGASQTFTLASVGDLTVGAGFAAQITGITKMGYLVARVTGIAGLVVTTSLDTTGFTGSFVSGTAYNFDRGTTYGSLQFIIFGTWAANLRAGRAYDYTKIILVGPLNYQDENADPGAQYSTAQISWRVANKYGLAFYDAGYDLNIGPSDVYDYFSDGVHPTEDGPRQAIANHFVRWAMGGATKTVNEAMYLPATLDSTGLAAKTPVDQQGATYSELAGGYGTPTVVVGNSSSVLTETWGAGLGSYTQTGAVPAIAVAPWGVDNSLTFIADATNTSSYLSRNLTMDLGVTVSFPIQLPVVSGVSPDGVKSVSIFTLRNTGLNFFINLTVRTDSIQFRIGYRETPNGVQHTLSYSESLVANTKYVVGLQVAIGLGMKLSINGTTVLRLATDNGTTTAPTSIQYGFVSPNISDDFTAYMGPLTITKQELLAYTTRFHGTQSQGGYDWTFVNGTLTARTAGTEGYLLRTIPAASITTGTAVLADKGKAIYASGNVTLPNSTYAAGDWIPVYNNTSGNITIAFAGTLRLDGTATTGTRTLAQRGWAHVRFIGATEAVVAGAAVT